MYQETYKYWEIASVGEQKTDPIVLAFRTEQN